MGEVISLAAIRDRAVGLTTLIALETPPCSDR
jgi:hypothetical protein